MAVDVIKYLINKSKRVLPFTVAKAVITNKGNSVQDELDTLRNDIQYYIEMYDPDYIQRLATSARYAREQGYYANSQGTYIVNNKDAIEKAVANSTYALEQGNEAKNAASEAKEQSAYIKQNRKAIEDSVFNSKYAKEQGDYAKGQADYIKERQTAIDESVKNSEDALLYATYAKGYKNYVDTIARRVLHGSRVFNVPEPTLPDTEASVTTN